jgi:hypothetical protein
VPNLVEIDGRRQCRAWNVRRRRVRQLPTVVHDVVSLNDAAAVKLRRARGRYKRRACGEALCAGTPVSLASWSNFFELRKFGLHRELHNHTSYRNRTFNTVKMANAKSTRKFEKTKLSGVLKQRKEGAKVKQRKQMDLKKKERKSRENARAEDLPGATTKKPASKAANDDALGEMSMDQFFEGGFQMPEMSKKTKSKTGKRKRTPVDEETNGDTAAAGAGDSASDSDSGDDEDAHKEQLADLQKKDPEFYKYLKENDAELLDFAEEADLAEIDALSASEDEATPRKKKKKAAADDSDDDDVATGNEITKALIQKWKTAMETKSSLRAMREVALAFRTAAHLNDEEGKNYKYSISDPDGISPVSSHAVRD